MKGTNRYENAHHGDHSQAPLQPHGLTVTLRHLQKMNALSSVSSVSSLVPWGTVPVKTAAQKEKDL